MAQERIPRMRTVSKIVSELKKMDPNTEVSEYYIRQIVKSGMVPVVWAGKKALINLDDVLELLREGTCRTSRIKPELSVVGGIRKINC